MCDSNETVIIEIEDKTIECNRKQLVDNSPYFKAMLEGSFKESNSKKIRLESVDYIALNLIIQQIKDISQTQVTFNNYDQVLMVLEAAQMLNFDSVLRMCVDFIISRLNAKNCIEVWLLAEQMSISPLNVKAKSIALSEFDTVKEFDNLMELNITNMHAYLSNTALQCQTEMDVFSTIMKWWYHNGNRLSSQTIGSTTGDETDDEKLVYLLSCVDFNNISKPNLNLMLTYPDIAGNSNLEQLLICVCCMKNFKKYTKFNEIIHKAAKLLLCTKSRYFPLIPCITSKTETALKEIPAKKMKVMEKSTEVLYFDEDLKDMQILLNIAPPTTRFCEKLEGYKVHSYKNHIYIIGGEYTLGTGDWNKNIWAYNFIDEKWERVQTICRERRHFKVCRVKTDLYIIGGTSTHRVLLDSMISFSLINYSWSQSSISFPCSVRYVDIECCEYNGQLFLLPKDLNNNKNAYIYDSVTNWSFLTIKDEHDLVQRFPGKYVLYSYKNCIYVKGDNLIEMEINEAILSVTGCRFCKPITSEIEDVVLIKNYLYTFSRHLDIMMDTDYYTIDKFNVETFEEDTIIFNIPEDGTYFNWKIASGCFSVINYAQLQKDIRVNDKSMELLETIKNIRNVNL